MSRQGRAPGAAEGSKGPGGRAGFTLLELLTALAVGCVVLAAAYAAFHACTGAERRGLAAMDTVRQARFAFDALARDAGRMPPGIAAGDLECAGERCLFPVLAANGTGVWVRYQAARDGLAREVFSQRPGGQDAVLIRSEELCRGLSRAGFRALDPETARPGERPWPRGLELDLIFAGQGNGDRHGATVLLETEPGRG
jgi:prepilin-type N-terminal cleavage/methylation domain-containing protein